MLQRLRNARLLLPTLAALAGLAVLIGLGTWQLERKRWKEDLIARIAAGARAEPIDLFRMVPEGQPGQIGIVGNPEYLHVTVRGRFHHAKEQYLYAPSSAGVGWHVYTPLEVAAGSGSVMWVNRGWVPDARKAPATRPEGQMQGEVEVRGLIRLQPKPGTFTPRNDPVRNLWYWPDLAAMTAAAFPDGLQNAPGGPQKGGAWNLAIEADAKPEPPGGLPRGGVTRLDLPNRHLEYALTWYGLAATLVGVYIAFAVGRLRGT